MYPHPTGYAGGYYPPVYPSGYQQHNMAAQTLAAPYQPRVGAAPQHAQQQPYLPMPQYVAPPGGGAGGQRYVPYTSQLGGAPIYEYPPSQGTPQAAVLPPRVGPPQVPLQYYTPQNRVGGYLIPRQPHTFQPLYPHHTGAMAPPGMAKHPPVTTAFSPSSLASFTASSLVTASGVTASSTRVKNDKIGLGNIGISPRPEPAGVASPLGDQRVLTSVVTEVTKTCKVAASILTHAPQKVDTTTGKAKTYTPGKEPGSYPLGQTVGSGSDRSSEASNNISGFRSSYHSPATYYSAKSSAASDADTAAREILYRRFAELLGNHGPQEPTSEVVLGLFLQLNPHERKMMMAQGSIRAFLTKSPYIGSTGDKLYLKQKIPPRSPTPPISQSPGSNQDRFRGGDLPSGYSSGYGEGSDNYAERCSTGYISDSCLDEEFDGADEDSYQEAVAMGSHGNTSQQENPSSDFQYDSDDEDYSTAEMSEIFRKSARHHGITISARASKENKTQGKPYRQEEKDTKSSDLNKNGDQKLFEEHGEETNGSEKEASSRDPPTSVSTAPSVVPKSNGDGPAEAFTKKSLLRNAAMEKTVMKILNEISKKDPALAKLKETSKDDMVDRILHKMAMKDPAYRASLERRSSRSESPVCEKVVLKEKVVPEVKKASSKDLVNSHSHEGQASSERTISRSQSPISRKIVSEVKMKSSKDQATSISQQGQALSERTSSRSQSPNIEKINSQVKEKSSKEPVTSSSQQGHAILHATDMYHMPSIHSSLGLSQKPETHTLTVSSDPLAALLKVDPDSMICKDTPNLPPVPGEESLSSSEKEIQNSHVGDKDKSSDDQNLWLSNNIPTEGTAVSTDGGNPDKTTHSDSASVICKNTKAVLKKHTEECNVEKVGERDDDCRPYSPASANVPKETKPSKQPNVTPEVEGPSGDGQEDEDTESLRSLDRKDEDDNRSSNNASIVATSGELIEEASTMNVEAEETVTKPAGSVKVVDEGVEIRRREGAAVGDDLEVCYVKSVKVHNEDAENSSSLDREAGGEVHEDSKQSTLVKDENDKTTSHKDTVKDLDPWVTEVPSEVTVKRAGIREIGSASEGSEDSETKINVVNRTRFVPEIPPYGATSESDQEETSSFLSADNADDNDDIEMENVLKRTRFIPEIPLYGATSESDQEETSSFLSEDNAEDDDDLKMEKSCLNSGSTIVEDTGVSDVKTVKDLDGDGEDSSPTRKCAKDKSSGVCSDTTVQDQDLIGESCDSSLLGSRNKELGICDTMNGKVQEENVETYGSSDIGKDLSTEVSGSSSGKAPEKDVKTCTSSADNAIEKELDVCDMTSTKTQDEGDEICDNSKIRAKEEAKGICDEKSVKVTTGEVVSNTLSSDTAKEGDVKICTVVGTGAIEEPRSTADRVDKKERRKIHRAKRTQIDCREPMEVEENKVHISEAGRVWKKSTKESPGEPGSLTDRVDKKERQKINRAKRCQIALKGQMEVEKNEVHISETGRVEKSIKSPGEPWSLTDRVDIKDTRKIYRAKRSQNNLKEDMEVKESEVAVSEAEKVEKSIKSPGESTEEDDMDALRGCIRKEWSTGNEEDNLLTSSGKEESRSNAKIKVPYFIKDHLVHLGCDKHFITAHNVDSVEFVETPSFSKKVVPEPSSSVTENVPSMEDLKDCSGPSTPLPVELDEDAPEVSMEPDVNVPLVAEKPKPALQPGVQSLTLCSVPSKLEEPELNAAAKQYCPQASRSPTNPTQEATFNIGAEEFRPRSSSFSIQPDLESQLSAAVEEFRPRSASFSVAPPMCHDSKLNALGDAFQPRSSSGYASEKPVQARKLDAGVKEFYPGSFSADSYALSGVSTRGRSEGPVDRVHKLKATAPDFRPRRRSEGSLRNPTLAMNEKDLRLKITAPEFLPRTSPVVTSSELRAESPEFRPRSGFSAGIPLTQEKKSTSSSAVQTTPTILTNRALNTTSIKTRERGTQGKVVFTKDETMNTTDSLFDRKSKCYIGAAQSRAVGTSTGRDLVPVASKCVGSDRLVVKHKGTVTDTVNDKSSSEVVSTGVQTVKAPDSVLYDEVLCRAMEAEIKVVQLYGEWYIRELTKAMYEMDTQHQQYIRLFHGSQEERAAIHRSFEAKLVELKKELARIEDVCTLHISAIRQGSKLEDLPQINLTIDLSMEKPALLPNIVKDGCGSPGRRNRAASGGNVMNPVRGAGPDEALTSPREPPGLNNMQDPVLVCSPKSPKKVTVLSPQSPAKPGIKPSIRSPLLQMEEASPEPGSRDGPPPIQRLVPNPMETSFPDVPSPVAPLMAAPSGNLQSLGADIGGATTPVAPAQWQNPIMLQAVMMQLLQLNPTLSANPGLLQMMAVRHLMNIQQLNEAAATQAGLASSGGLANSVGGTVTDAPSFSMGGLSLDIETPPSTVSPSAGIAVSVSSTATPSGGVVNVPSTASPSQGAVTTDDQLSRDASSGRSTPSTDHSIISTTRSTSVRTTNTNPSETKTVIPEPSTKDVRKPGSIITPKKPKSKPPLRRPGMLSGSSRPSLASDISDDDDGSYAQLMSGGKPIENTVRAIWEDSRPLTTKGEQKENSHILVTASNKEVPKNTELAKKSGAEHHGEKVVEISKSKTKSEAANSQFLDKLQKYSSPDNILVSSTMYASSQSLEDPIPPRGRGVRQTRLVASRSVSETSMESWEEEVDPYPAPFKWGNSDEILEDQSDMPHHPVGLGTKKKRQKSGTQKVQNVAPVTDITALGRKTVSGSVGSGETQARRHGSGDAHSQPLSRSAWPTPESSSEGPSLMSADGWWDRKTGSPQPQRTVSSKAESVWSQKKTSEKATPAPPKSSQSQESVKSKMADSTNPLLLKSKSQAAGKDMGKRPSGGSNGKMSQLSRIDLDKKAEGQKEQQEEVEDEWQQVGKKGKHVKQEALSSVARQGGAVAKGSNFEILLSKLSQNFPDLSRSEVMALVTEVRTRHGGFAGISLRQLINEAAECMTIKATNSKPGQMATNLDAERLKTLRYKTEMCQLYLQDSCKLGKRCVYAHGKAELRPLPKIELCPNYGPGKNCIYGEKCVFAHGEKDLRVKVAPGGHPPRLVSPNPPSYVEAMEPSWLNTENQFVPPPRAVQWPARRAKQQHSVINTPVNYLDDEDVEVCIICMDPLPSSGSKKLECGHEFHVECINRWVYGEERTCPTCRQHALLPEDFPRLGSK